MQYVYPPVCRNHLFYLNTAAFGLHDQGDEAASLGRPWVWWNDLERSVVQNKRKEIQIAPHRGHIPLMQSDKW